SDAVALATFLGGPLAGALLMAQNYRKLGKTVPALNMVGIGVLGMGLGMAAGHFIPREAYIAIPIALVAGMRQLANATQGPAIEEHKDRGGDLGSNWVAIGLGGAFLAVVLAIIFLPMMMEPHNRVQVTDKDAVYYTGQATAREAEGLGDELK